LKEIKVRYHDKNLEKLKMIEKGNWIDLRASSVKYEPTPGYWVERPLYNNPFYYPECTTMMINLGVSIDLGEYEAHVVPRSSTFKNYHLIQTNSIGIIDSSYNGDDDIWYFPCYAIRGGVLHHNDRICQFRLFDVMDFISIEEVKYLNNLNRGGFGSTGVK
jgi:dUTP pyrophosphatase